MTPPACLLLAALAAAPPPHPGPAPLTGLRATPAPGVIEPLVRGQSPAFAPPPGAPSPGGWVPAPAPLPFAAPPAPGAAFEYGVTNPRPYDFAPELRFDAGYLFPASTTRGGTLGVTELDFVLDAAAPAPGGGVFTVAPEYRLRTLTNPGVGPGDVPLPGNLHRLGADFALATPRVGPWSATAGFTPSINTDFEGSLASPATQYDGRAAVFYEANPRLTLIGGVRYLDRVDDLLLPWAGAVWRPDDRWEVRAVFPDPQVSYFYGPVLGKPMWVYAGFRFRREAWQIRPDTADPAVASPDAVQFTDFRFILGARKEQGWGRTFLEAGLVFDRDVDFARTPGAGFDVGETLILRGGVRF